MRYGARTDKNQSEIVRDLRMVGANVVSLASIGKGCPDLLVQFRGNLYLLEVKNGANIPSQKRLKPDQIKFREIWRSSVVYCTADAFRLIGVIPQ